MIVHEGDVIVADGELLSGERLSFDESSLTGESALSVKSAGSLKAERLVLAGTTLLAGHGVVGVLQTGANTEYGRIGALMSEIPFTRTPIERSIHKIVTQIGVLVLLVCLIVIAVERLHGTLWPLAIIAGVSLAMAALPEELPMVYTLYLALGAWRLAKDHALVRRLSSVETLGSTSIICVDKTGTLTFGKLDVTAIRPNGSTSSDDLLKTAAMACDALPHDPLDKAILEIVSKTGGISIDPALRVHDYPFEAAKRFAAKVWREDDHFVVVVKGALEVILRLCSATEQERAALLLANEELASQGTRVIAVARANVNTAEAQSTLDSCALQFAGLIGFGDPIRPDVAPSLQECRDAGIRVIMITGDHPATARYVAGQIGLSGDVITGPEVESIADAELHERILRTDIFARTRADQKLRIVRALHAHNLIVAMTGDGTNDALALREADIGIAMGRHGTDVARGAADLVLLDDDFTTIVRAVRDGRRIFDNLAHAFRYLIAFHMPLLLSAFVIPFTGAPLLLLPIHLVGLELIVHPTSALVFENDPADRDLMKRRPRPRDGGLLNVGDWVRPLLTGVLLTLAVLALYFFDLRSGDSSELARSTALFAMVVGQMMLVLTERAVAHPVWFTPIRGNKAILPIILLTLGGLLAVTYIPQFDAAMKLAPLSLHSLYTAVGVALVATLSPEFSKIAWTKRIPSR